MSVNDVPNGTKSVQGNKKCARAFVALHGLLRSSVALYGPFFAILWLYIAFSRGQRSKFIWSCSLFNLTLDSMVNIKFEKNHYSGFFFNLNHIIAKIWTFFVASWRVVESVVSKMRLRFCAVFLQSNWFSLRHWNRGQWSRCWIEISDLARLRISFIKWMINKTNDFENALMKK